MVEKNHTTLSNDQMRTTTEHNLVTTRTSDSLNDKSSNEPLEKQRSDGVEQYSLNQIKPWRESWIVK